MKFELNKVCAILSLYTDLLEDRAVKISEKYIEIYDAANTLLITFEILEDSKLNICFNYDDYYTIGELEDIADLFDDLKGNLRK